MRSHDRYTTLLHISILLFITSVQGEKEYFEKEPENITAIAGTDVVMQCVIKDKYIGTQFFLTWYRNDQKIIISSDSNFEYFDADPHGTGDWSLKVLTVNVSQRDGSYHCLIEPHTSPAEHSRKGEVTVSVVLGMTFNEEDIIGEHYVMVKAEDESEEFECWARGANLEPVINWFLDYENITNSAEQEDGTSTLNHAFKPGVDGDNRKLLVCKIFVQDLRRRENLMTGLNVQYMMEDVNITILHDGRETIDAGNKLELECVADGNPEPVYTWSKDDKTLLETGRILTRDSVTLEDEGLYKCEAKNDFGEGSAEQQITVKEKRNVAMIVGLTFGVLVLVIIIIAIFAFVKKIWCFKRMAPAKPDEEQTGGPNSYVLNPQPTQYPDNSAMRQRGEFEETAKLYAKPDKTKKKESQKHPVAQESEALYKKDAPSQKVTI